MNTPRGGLRTASVLFGIMALAQLWRVVTHPEVLLDGMVVPVWPSALAMFVLAVLALWLWRLSNRA